MTAWGCDVIEVRFVPDTVEAHLDALRVDHSADLVVTTGGTAHGPVDYLHAAIEKSDGELIVDSVDCRPGHPMLTARWATHHLLGLPGNPQAAIAALHTLGAPLLRAMFGMSLPILPSVTFSGSAKRRDRETRLIPCTLENGVATPVEHIGSGMLRGLTHADGFAVLTGESVEWIALQQL
jgi:molybdopterin molybdotransferase